MAQQKSAGVADDPFGTSAGQGIIAPQVEETKPMSEGASPEAWGKVGQAVQGAGQAVESESQKYGEIYNDTAARDRTVQNSQKAGELFEQYRQNRGLNAPDAFKTFQQQMQQLYQQGGQGLSLSANKMYQDQFAPIIDRHLSNAGSWAADQTYAAQNQSLDAAIGNNNNLMATSGGNLSEMQRLSQSTHDMSIQRAHADGLSVESATNLSSKNVGAGWADAITVAQKTNPDQAQQLWKIASTGSFTETRQDGTTIKIPYMDAQQQAKTAGEMKQISNQQEAQAFNDARSFAISGADYDKNAVSATMRRNGKSQEDIDANLARLNSIQSNFGSSFHKYDIQKTLENNNHLMEQGLPTKTLDPDYVRSVFPKEPNKAQDIIDENNNQHVVASVVGQFPTQTPAQRQEVLQRYKPNTSQVPSDNALDTVLKHEGGYVAQDGSSGAPAIYGINQKWHPTEYAAAKNLADTKGDAAGQQYARNFYKTQYYDAKGIDKLPENTQSIVLDGVVNHTPAFGDKLIQAAKDGATPQQLIDMRRGEYQRLADSDAGKPADQQKYAPSLTGWNARLDDLQNPGSGNFSTKDRLYSTMQTAESNYTKRLNDDPAGTLVQADPILAKAGGDFKDPSQYGTFIDASMKRQEAIGVPENMRSALPASVASGLANNIVQNPETAPAAINSLATKTGPYWPQVYHSLVTQGGLPPVYQHIAQLGSSDDPQVQNDASLLAKWTGDADLKGKQNADLVGGAKNETDIKTVIRSSPVVQNYLQSILNSGASKAQYEGALNAMDSLAYAKTFYERQTDPTKAATDAVSAFTSKYEFMPNGNARVPAQNFDAVTQNAQQMLDNIDKTAVAPPIAKTGFHGLRNEQDYFNSVRGNPTWITTNDDKGIQLVDPWGHFVAGKDGKPLTIPMNAPLVRTPQTTQNPNPLMGAGETVGM